MLHRAILELSEQPIGAIAKYFFTATAARCSVFSRSSPSRTCKLYECVQAELVSVFIKMKKLPLAVAPPAPAAHVMATVLDHISRERDERQCVPDCTTTHSNERSQTN